jgi:tetratricopeptide (TPR) repeat protein
LLDVKVFSIPFFFAQEVDIRTTLASAYRGSQEYANAMQEYQSILALGRHDFEAIAGLAECSFLLRDFEGANRYYKKLLTISYTKRDFNYYYTIGRAYMVLLDYGKAIIHFKKALEFREKEEMIKRYLEVCYREAGSR